MITTLFGTVFFCKYSVLFSSYFLLSVILFVCQKGGDDMQKENNLTVRKWCDQGLPPIGTNGMATPRADIAT